MAATSGRYTSCADATVSIACSHTFQDCPPLGNVRVLILDFVSMYYHTIAAAGFIEDTMMSAKELLHG